MRKKFLHITKDVYKYGIPIHLLTLTALWFIKPQYGIIWDCWFSYAGLHWMFREYRESVLRGKCEWQMASIIGTAVYFMIDIFFYGNYFVYPDGVKSYNPNYHYAVLIVLAMSVFAVIGLKYKEYATKKT